MHRRPRLDWRSWSGTKAASGLFDRNRPPERRPVAGPVYCIGIMIAVVDFCPAAVTLRGYSPVVRVEIRKKLMDSDPGNQRYQDLVATAYTLLAENMARGGDREAVDLAKNGLEFTEGVNRTNPSLHTQAQVAESLGALGDACEAVKPKQCDAQQYWQRAKVLYVLMRSQGSLNIDQAQQIAALEDKLAGRAVAAASGPGPGLSGSAGSRGR